MTNTHVAVGVISRWKRHLSSDLGGGWWDEGIWVQSGQGPEPEGLVSGSFCLVDLYQACRGKLNSLQSVPHLQ